MIELNKPYQAKELAKALNMSERSFRGRRQEIEEYFTQNYEWSMTKSGRSHIYIFTSFYGSKQEFKHERINAAPEKPIGKREQNTQNRIHEFKELVWDELSEHPYNTKTNIVNRLWMKDCGFGYVTIKKYVDLALKEHHEVNNIYLADKATLCVYNDDSKIYTPLKPTDVNEYFKLWKLEYVFSKDATTAFMVANKAYKEVCGGSLRWVHKMELNAWRNDND